MLQGLSGLLATLFLAAARSQEVAANQYRRRRGGCEPRELNARQLPPPVGTPTIPVLHHMTARDGHGIGLRFRARITLNVNLAPFVFAVRRIRPPCDGLALLSSGRPR